MTSVGDGWVRPYWMQRQRAPGSTNTGCRNWTVVGNLASPFEATVDPRGLVTPRPGGWSVDWWIGAEDAWHTPSSTSATRVQQRLVASSPVVETSVRVPGGYAVQRTYACHAGLTGGTDSEAVVIEIENRSAVPFAVAVAVRPYDLEHVVPIERIEWDGGRTVTVNGIVGLMLSRPPAQIAASTGGLGDCAARVLANAAVPADAPLEVVDEAGLAQAAFVFPLAHTATLGVVLPMSGVSAAPPEAVPSSEQVTRGWRAQDGAGARLVLPDEKLQEAVDANRRFLLSWLARSRPDEDAAVLVALAQHGFSTMVDGELRAPSELLAIEQPKTTPVAFDATRPSAVMAVARGELAGGDRRALERLTWLLAAASPTWTWPAAMEPETGLGVEGDGHDRATAALFLSFVRELLVRESGHQAAHRRDAGPGLVLCGMVPDGWIGQGWEVHDAPTRHGQLSFAIRWHGERPALLWELVPTGGGPPPVLSAPGLDPSWSSTDMRGEALLAATNPSVTAS